MWQNQVRKGEEMWKEDVKIFVYLFIEKFLSGGNWHQKKHVQFVCLWIDK